MLPSDQNDPDRNLFVKFYKGFVKNNKRSEEEGRLVCDEKTFVSIIAPGDATTKIERPASDHDKERFHRQWSAYERGESEKVEGTPLEQWPQLNRARVEELKWMKFIVVEQIAAMNDAQCQRVGPDGYTLREKAKAYIGHAKETAQEQKYAAENQRLRDEMEALKQQMAEVMKQSAPKKPGRPPKAQLEAAA